MSDSSIPPLQCNRYATRLSRAGPTDSMHVDTCGLKKGEACTLCYEEQGDHVLVPCGHGGFCGGCPYRLLSQHTPQRACPLCRNQLTSIVKVPLDAEIGARIDVLRAYAVAPLQTVQMQHQGDTSPSAAEHTGLGQSRPLTLVSPLIQRGPEILEDERLSASDAPAVDASAATTHVHTLEAPAGTMNRDHQDPPSMHTVLQDLLAGNRRSPLASVLSPSWHRGLD